MLVEKRKKLIRLTSFVLILALIFSIPMLGQFNNVYAEGESATSAGVEKSTEKEEVVTPSGVDTKKTESDTEKSKDKKVSDKLAKASETAEFTFDISEGNIIIGNGANTGTLKVVYGNSLTEDNIDANQMITIIGSTAKNNIYISAGTKVNLTLKNVSIKLSSGTPIQMIAGSTVNLNLMGSNSLEGGYHFAGLYVPSNATLVIDAEDNKQHLTAKGGTGGAGIGGSARSTMNAGNITVLNGNVDATGGENSAGIGGAYNSSSYKGRGGNVTISGGIVKATGGTGGAGIGGSMGSNGGSTSISGGSINAIGGSGGAGIGGGSGSGQYSLPSGNGGTIKISGGDITATGGNAAGIGGGNGTTAVSNNASSGAITITGGRVVASAAAGSGIGTGRLGTTEGSIVTIKGGSVKATSNAISVNPQPTNGTENVYCNTLTIGSPNIGDNKEIASIMVKGITPSYGLTDAKTMDGGKMYFWLPMSGSGGTNKEVVKATYNSDDYCYNYARDANAQVRTLKQSFEVSGKISGLSNVSNVAIDYSIDGAPSGTVYTNTSGNYKITVGALEEISIYPVERSGYGISPSSRHFTEIYEDIQNVDFEFKPNNYELHFKGNGGVVGQDTKTVTYGAAVGDLPIATKVGYKFTGWNTSETGSGSEFKEDTEMSIANDVTLYAIYNANDYVVSFDSNGGNTPSKTTMGATYDGPYGTLATVSRTGYAFDGWYTTTAYAVKITSGSIVNALEDHTLYAKWKVNDYEVSFNANGGNVPSKTTMGATYDDPYGTLATVSRTGYTFSGWYTTGYALEITSGSIVNTAEDHTLYAKWKANDYEVSFNANGGNAPSITTMGATYDDPYGALATTSRTKYTFDGWYTTGYAVEITSGSIVNIDDDHTLYAKWSANNYKVTLDVNGGDKLADNEKNVTMDGTYGYLPTPTKKGHSFQGWYTAKTGGTKITADSKVEITDDQILYAQWKANSYKVTFNANAKKVKKLTPKSKNVTYNAKLGKLPSPKKAGYKFKGWYTKKSGGAKVTKDSIMKYDKNITLYAKWTKNGKLYAKWTKNGKIIKSDVNVHKTPYNSGTVIKKLKKGTKVCILKKVKRGKYTWYKIKAGKKTGYVYSKYVKKI